MASSGPNKISIQTSASYVCRHARVDAELPRTGFKMREGEAPAEPLRKSIRLGGSLALPVLKLVLVRFRVARPEYANGVLSPPERNHALRRASGRPTQPPIKSPDRLTGR